MEWYNSAALLHNVVRHAKLYKLIEWHNSFPLSFLGDKGDRGRLQVAAAHGMSAGVTSAHAGVLDEGTGRQTQI